MLFFAGNCEPQAKRSGAVVQNTRACLLLQHGKAEQAEGPLRAAIETARSQQAKTLELRATTDLARLWQGQGRIDDALAVLQPLCWWFSEGFASRDLKRAAEMLDALQSAPAHGLMQSKDSRAVA